MNFAPSYRRDVELRRAVVRFVCGVFVMMGATASQARSPRADWREIRHAPAGQDQTAATRISSHFQTASANHDDDPAETDDDANDLYHPTIVLQENDEPSWRPRFRPATKSSEPRLSSYGWHVAPEGVLYKSYIAGEKEPRIQSQWLNQKGRGLIWEPQVGGRAALVRHGTNDPQNPEGWEIQVEGGAQVRIDPGQNDDVDSVDFRTGFLWAYRKETTSVKMGIYHLSSHLGDEFLLKHPGYKRLNYVRDSVICGVTEELTEKVQVYGEMAYAFNAEDGAKPLEFQSGVQYSPPTFGIHGAPFAAINVHMRQDFNYETSMNVLAGWQWRGDTNHLFRIGLQYYNGPSIQWSFVNKHESLLGGGLWYDF